jgi:hypothetical protein
MRFRIDRIARASSMIRARTPSPFVVGAGSSLVLPAGTDKSSVRRGVS